MSRTLVVGDVHGCARELKKLIAKAAPTRVILAGDLFTKGPNPIGVWKLIRKHNIEAVLGNTDIRVVKTWEKHRKLPPQAIRWLAQLPWSIDEGGWVVVHGGVHPMRGLAGTTREMALDLRYWPNNRPKNPPWWELYDGSKLVLHGHAARHGLVDWRPHSLGLDTGCVYGGRLTGYVVERDELVSVKAKKAWVEFEGPRIRKRFKK